MRAPRRVRPVDRVLDRLAERAGLIRSEAPTWGPSEAMGARFDINGSIWLSDLLDTADDTQAEAQTEVPEDLDSLLEAALPFRDRIEARIRSVRNGVRRRYREPFGGAQPLPGPAAALTALERSGGRPKTGQKAAGLAARAISGAHTVRLARALKTARAELVFLRDDIGPEIARLGPGAAELERTDAALSRALIVAARGLTDDLLEHVEAAFERTFVQAALALPKGPSDDPAVVAAVQAWYAEDGFMRAHAHDCEELALVLYDRDAELLTQLVDAACELAAATGAV